ncbi:MAG TPA: Coq4 family protein [Polyangiales bacterium]|nr:Coq4 family protein [Polyangiales bacterium]
MSTPATRVARRSRASEVLHQWSLYLRGAYQFVRRPVSRQTFTALSEALVRFRSNADSVRFMMQDPRVAKLCRERYLGAVYVPEELLRYPPGSLGHEFGAAMVAENFDPEFYRDYYGREPYHFENDEQYLRFRIRQIHDIVHVLTGFGANDIPGELGMQAFNAAQTRRPFSLALVGFGLLRMVLNPRDLPHTLQQIAKGFAMGYAADQLLAHRYEDDWSKPLDAWRSELNLTPERSFEFGSQGRARV